MKSTTQSTTSPCTSVSNIYTMTGFQTEIMSHFRGDSGDRAANGCQFGSVFLCIIEEMDQEDLIDVAHAALNQMLAAPPNPLRAIPAVEFEFNTAQTVNEDLNGVYDSYLPLEAATLGFEHPFTAAATLSVEQPLPNSYYLNAMSDDLYNHGQMQRLPYQWSEYDAPTAAIRAPPHSILPSGMPQVLEQNMKTVGMIKRKCKGQQVEERPYVKKPPNAFMLFMKEHRANVVEELKLSDNAMVNMALGDRWRLMSDTRQAKYYEEAERLRKQHAEKYPWWTTHDNYGKKRKRIRRRCPVIFEEDEEDDGEEEEEEEDTI